MSIDLHALAEVGSATLLNSVALGIGLAVFAWAALRLLGRPGSSTRFAVWYSALLAIAIIPVFSSVVSGTTLSNSRVAITIPGSWATYLLLAWAAVAGIGLLRVGTGLWRIRKLRGSAAPLEHEELSTLLQKTAEDFPMGRCVEICRSDSVQVPTAIGFFRPMVLIPGWSLEELSSTELSSVVLHELAHLRRWDDWTNLLQRVVGAILFFHPAVWWVGNKLSLEREMACDDLVLNATGSPQVYAQCLVSMAEKSFVRRGLAMAQAAVGRMRQTSLRVSQILDTRRTGVTRIWKPSLALLAVGTLSAFAAVPHLPRLVAFAGEPTEIAHTSMGPETAEGYRTDARVVQASIHQDLLAPAASVRPTAALMSRTGEEHSFSRAAHRTMATRAIAPQVRVSSNLASVNARVAPRPAQPIVVRASLNAQEDVKTPDLFFVVMHTQQYGPSGPTFWSISVYRLTVFHPSKQQIQNETPAKST
jgi:beta-lactamase regulating signal transducer with metallopeptidase domain